MTEAVLVCKKMLDKWEPSAEVFSFILEIPAAGQQAKCLYNGGVRCEP